MPRSRPQKRSRYTTRLYGATPHESPNLLHTDRRRCRSGRGSGKGGGGWGGRGGKGAAEEEKESTGDGCVCGECREVEILEVNVLVCVLYTTKIG